MADDQSNKRLKTTSGASGASRGDTSDDARNKYALYPENHDLRSENARLRHQLELLQGNRHETIPVSTLTVVDLSRVDTSIITQVASFLGTPLELLNLALTCKSFGWQQSETGSDWSLADEVARLTVCSGQNDIEGVRITLPPQYVRGTTTWLSVLHESAHPLKFDTLLGSGIEHQNERSTSIRLTTSVTSTAIASSYVMESGIHYAVFHTSKSNFIGVVRPVPNLDPGRFVNPNFHFFVTELFAYFLAARTDKWGSGNVHVCEYECEYGSMTWTNWDSNTSVDWEGMEDCNTGDTIGMLLNLEEGTLTIYKNNRRLGVMKDGLSGSYCWYVSVGKKGSTIAIKRGKPPRCPHQSMLEDSEDNDSRPDVDEGIEVEGCGLSEINGYFRRIGSHDDCPRFCKRAFFRGRDEVFSLFRCRLNDSTR